MILACPAPLRRLLLAAAVLAGPAHAADGMAAADRLVGGGCQRAVSSLTNRADFAPMLHSRPLEAAAICGCTRQRFVQDPRLQPTLLADEGLLRERMRDETFRAYVQGRLFHAVLSCLVPELEASLGQLPVTP